MIETSVLCWNIYRISRGGAVLLGATRPFDLPAAASSASVALFWAEFTGDVGGHVTYLYRFVRGFFFFYFPETTSSTEHTGEDVTET